MDIMSFIYFNSIKVQLEHFKDSRVQRFEAYFNSIKVQLEQAKVRPFKLPEFISIP